jgi:4'-phosphopantetheinyl transferase EntD
MPPRCRTGNRFNVEAIRGLGEGQLNDHDNLLSSGPASPVIGRPPSCGLCSGQHFRQSHFLDFSSSLRAGSAGIQVVWQTLIHDHPTSISAGVIERLLPPMFGKAEAFGSGVGYRLFPDEEAVVSRASEQRRREFTTGRNCARLAMRQLGLPPQSLPRGKAGMPQWPAGIVGSITHCSGYCAAAVGAVTDVRSVGIDAEPNVPARRSILPSIASAAEIADLRKLALHYPDVHWDRLLFSAKEAVYKAWSPMTGAWLGFKDVEVAIAPTDGTFLARICTPGAVADDPREFAGQWVCSDLIVTSVVVPAVGDARVA